MNVIITKQGLSTHFAALQKRLHTIPTPSPCSTRSRTKTRPPPERPGNRRGPYPRRPHRSPAVKETRPQKRPAHRPTASVQHPRTPTTPRHQPTPQDRQFMIEHSRQISISDLTAHPINQLQGKLAAENLERIIQGQTVRGRTVRGETRQARPGQRAIRIGKHDRPAGQRNRTDQPRSPGNDPQFPARPDRVHHPQTAAGPGHIQQREPPRQETDSPAVSPKRMPGQHPRPRTALWGK